MANLLILFGFAWMVVAAIIGLLLARRRELVKIELEKMAVKGDLTEYHRLDLIYKWNKTVHSHAMLFSVVAVSVGLAMERMNYPEMVIKALAWALMIAAIVWTIGGLRSNRWLMLIGDVALLGSMVATVVGLAKAM